MWRVLLALAAVAVSCRGQTSSILTPSDGEVLQLGGFGAGLIPSLLPPLWDAEGVYVANHTAGQRQWRHAARPHLRLTYEPITAGPTAPRHWLVLNLGPDEDRLRQGAPVAELPQAGPQPWRHRARGGWKARDCTGRLRGTAAQLTPVTELRQQGSCATLAWRLVGLGDHHPSLAPLAGLYRATDRYSAGAPVYRADSGGELLRVVSGARSSWVLGPAGADATQLASLEEFADRVNLIRTERFVAAALSGRDFRDRLAFLCAPEAWEGGDTDFQLPHLDGYTASVSPAGRLQWRRQPLSQADGGRYQRAFDSLPGEHARAMIFQVNASDAESAAVQAELLSPPVLLTSDGCALLRLRNDGFRLTVLLRAGDGSQQQLLRSRSLSGWRDVVAPLPSSGQLVFRADQPDAAGARLTLTQVLVFNETCDRLQGRASACQGVTCLNGGTCTSVTIKHHLCFCKTGYLGTRCERRVDCGPPPEIANGRVAHQSGSTYLDRAYYDCLPGHAPSETVLGLAWSSCHHTGSWVNVPHCLPRGGASQPHIECHFDSDCVGFNTRVDNDYNTDTDEAWQRVERLKTSNIRGEGAFLTVYRPDGRRPLTARLLTPCLDLHAPGCLRLDFQLTNAALQLLEWRSDRAVFEASEGGRGRLVPLKARTEPLLLTIRLGEGESEAALDAVRVYRQSCEQLTDLAADSGGLAWHTWETPDQLDQANETGRSATPAASAGGLYSPLVLLLVPLLLLAGLLLVLGVSKDR